MLRLWLCWQIMIWLHPQALISALGPQWEKALEVFAEMKEKAKADPECQPNTITYSVSTMPLDCIHSRPKSSQRVPGLRPPLRNVSAWTCCRRR